MSREVSVVGESSDGVRLDRFLTEQHPEISRSVVQREIREGRVFVSDDVVSRPAHTLRPGQQVSWTPPQLERLKPRPLDLSILYEDEVMVVIDKPTGLVVHPGAGTQETTLVEGLLTTRSLPSTDDPARPGVVHRLDKETSGVLLVAKTSDALRHMQSQFADRMVAKSYLTVVEGNLDEDEGLIDAPIGRDPTRPSRMAVQPAGRTAQTEFDVLHRLGDRTLLYVRPRTGRTHQIRVHLAYTEHPVVGDTIYRGRPASSRLMLHAWRLVLRHPTRGDVMQFEAPIPEAFPPFAYQTIPWRSVPELG